jgi:hypothetical protein
MTRLFAAVLAVSLLAAGVASAHPHHHWHHHHRMWRHH